MKNECRDMSRQIPQFIAGDLAAEEASRLKLHLEACESCRAVAERYRIMLSDGKRFEPEISYGAAWNKIAEGLHGRETSRKEDIGFLAVHKTAILLASACAILLMAFVLTRPLRIPPAMSISEMEEILRSTGDLDGSGEKALRYTAHDSYRLMGSSESERLQRIPGVGTTHDKTYRIEPF